MDIQTERLESQQARLTVAVEPDRLEGAKKAAARRLSKRDNIRGFRRGKAPYPIVLRHFGEAAIIEEALEVLGNEVYREALSQSDLMAYGPGQLENFSNDPGPQFIFTLPLQPEVDLQDYRDIRIEYDAPTISDEDFEQQLKSLRYQNAIFEESRGAVANGDRVSIDYHVTFADEPKPMDDNADESEEELAALSIGSDFSRGEDQSLWLAAEEEPLLPGFRAALLGTELEEEREFTLIIPDDERYRRDITGRTVDCRVKIRKIENVTLPDLNDAFAANFTKEEAEPLTLLQLRVRIRENMQTQADEQARSAYIREVQEAILKQANVQYPEAMISDEVEARVTRFTDELQMSYKLKLADYQRIQGTSDEDLREEFRPEAQQNLEVWLLRDAIRIQEKISITPAMITEEVDGILANLGERTDEDLRARYQDTEVQTRIANSLLQKQIDERLFEIGRGEAPIPIEQTEGELSTRDEISPTGGEESTE